MRSILLAAAIVASCGAEPEEEDIAARCSDMPVLLDCTDGPCVCAQDTRFCGEPMNDGTLCCSEEGQSNVLAIGVCMKSECVQLSCATSR